jgi:alkyl hydroperoxide reductase subunit AhpC
MLSNFVNHGRLQALFTHNYITMDDMMYDEIFYPCAKVGQAAPHFEGEAYTQGDFKKISLEDYKGKWLMLFFYPLDFTFVCPTEIKGYSVAIEEFKKRNVEVLGCSIDSVHSHKAWSEGDLGAVHFPLLSDITKDISDAYGVLIDEEGIALRGTFIINPEGILKYMAVHDNNIGRSTEETLRVIDALQSGGLCPMDWHEGDANLQG